MLLLLLLNTCTQSAIAFTAQVITGFLPKLTLIDLWPAAILTAAAMLLIGCMNSDQAINAIDWTVYITIAFAFGVSAGARAGLYWARRPHRRGWLFVACRRVTGDETTS